MNSEGGTTESQIRSFKSDLRCHLSQTTQHRSHSFVSMAWRLVLRDRFTLPKIFQDAILSQFAFHIALWRVWGKSSEVKVCNRNVETMPFILVTQALHLGKLFHFATAMLSVVRGSVERGHSLYLRNPISETDYLWNNFTHLWHVLPLAGGELWNNGRQGDTGRGWRKARSRLEQLSRIGVVVTGMEKSGWIQDQFERKRVWWKKPGGQAGGINL